MLTLVIVEGVVVALLAFLVVGLLKSHAEILRQLHEIGLGPQGSEAPPRPTMGAPLGAAGAAPAHDLAGETPDGEVVAVGVAGAAHNTLVAFLSGGCATCAEFWRAFATPDRLGLAAHTRLVVVTRGGEAESVTAIRAVTPAGLTVVMSTQGWDDYAVPGSPYFVLVDGPGATVVGEGTGTSWAQVQSLMGQALGDRSAHNGRSARPRRTDRGRMDTDDAELRAAGIGPGHASLFDGPHTAPATPTATTPATATPATEPQPTATAPTASRSDQ